MSDWYWIEFPRMTNEPGKTLTFNDVLKRVYTDPLRERMPRPARVDPTSDETLERWIAANTDETIEEFAARLERESV